jgi:DNA-binding LacI/PurR family transcriptional regulator
VGPEKRKKIEQLIRRLKFIPNGTARSLVKKETRIINVVIPSVQFFTHFNNNRFIMGAQDVLEQNGYRITFTALSQSYRAYQALDNLMADAVMVFLWGEPQFKVIAELKKFKYPILAVYAHCTLPGVHNIFLDSFPAMYQLTRHAIECGHRRIVYAETFPLSYDQQRSLAGVRQAVSEGPVVDYENIKLVNVDDIQHHDEHMFLLGRQLVDGLGSLSFSPDLLMFSHDLLAFGAIQRLRELGKQIPGDMAVTGHGDHPLSNVLQPGLTTTQDPSTAAGKRAARILLEIALKKNKRIFRETITTEPLLRESIGNR